MTDVNARGRGVVLALLSAATFSTSGSFARSLINAGWTPAAAVAARITTAALILAIPVFLAARANPGALRRHHRLLLSYGVIAVAGGQLCYFNAIQHLSVGVALLLEYLGTILVVAWMWMRHGQKPRRLTVVGSVIALAGLVLVLDLAGDTRIDVIGVLWGLAAAVGLATYFVLSSKGGADVPPIMIAGSGLAIGAITLFALGVTGALPMAATFGEVTFAGHQVSWLWPVLGLSVVAAAFAYLAGIAAARALGPRLSSFLGLTEVLFAVLVAWLVLGELPTSMQMAGGLLIILGVVLVHVDEMRSERPDTAPRPELDEPMASTHPTSRAA